MQSIHYFKTYFDGIMVCSPLSFTYSHPQQLLEMLSQVSGMPYFICRTDFIPKYEQANEIPPDFKGWQVCYGINENMNEHFIKHGYVHVHLHKNDIVPYASLLFFQHAVIITGLSPFTPLATYNEYFNNDEEALNEVIVFCSNAILEQRLEIKKLLQIIGSRKAYYFHKNNQRAFELLTSSSSNSLIEMETAASSFSIDTLQHWQAINEMVVYSDEFTTN